MKDILIIRPGKQFNDAHPKQTDLIANSFITKFDKDFYCIVIWNENETNRTEFEIIHT